MTKKFIDTQWQVIITDCWGKPLDWVKVLTIDLRLKIDPSNNSAYPSDTQIRKAIGCPRVQIETTGNNNDTIIIVKLIRDGYPAPVGELRCISHSSLSPIN